MPRTPPTIVAPLPHDPRVMSLAKSVSLTRREAFAAAAEAWAWMSVMAVDDIVPQTAPDSLDSVVDIADFGQAMLQAGLVGVVNDGLVLPAELRRRERDQRAARVAADVEDDGDRRERDRKGARIRKRRSRAQKRLTKPATPSQVADVPATTTTAPRKLGTVDGFAVMLIYSRKNACWFYKLAGASPKEWTGTVSDQDNPSFADALAALHATMQRESGKGLNDGGTFRPSIDSVVAAAERYRAERAAAAADAARRDEANKAFAEASAEDQDAADQEPAERDSHADVTTDERDTVTVTEVSRQKSVTCQPKTNSEADFGSVTCHAPVTVAALSSSSPFGFVGNEGKENTTTTSGVTPAKRDHEDDILDRLCPREDPTQARQRGQLEQLLTLYAQGLGSTVDGVAYQLHNSRDILLARLKAAGIDPKTGLRVDAGAPQKPVGVTSDTRATVESTTSSSPAAGIVVARGGGGADQRSQMVFDCPSDELRWGLEHQGVPVPSIQSPPAAGA
jgi:hypothetical protein